MKKIVRLCLALALVAGMAAAAMAAPLIVAHDTNFKPFSFKDESGQYTGFDLEIWQEIAKRLNVEYEFQSMDFNGIIPGLQTGNIDVGIAAMTITDQRQEVVDMSDPYFDTGIMMAVRTEDVGKYKSLDDLKGQIIASKTGTAPADYLRDVFKQAGEVKLFPNADGMYLEVLSKGAEAVFFDESVVRGFAAASDGQLTVVGPLYMGQSYGIGFPKGRDLVGQVDEALAAMKADGTYETLYVKWFGAAPVKQ